MLVTVFVVLSLTITTTTVMSDDCEDQYTLALNDFFGDQECFTAYYQIQQSWQNSIFDDATTYSDTLCNGNCGAALNRILYYQDRVIGDTRDQVSQICTAFTTVTNSH